MWSTLVPGAPGCLELVDDTEVETIGHGEDSTVINASLVKKLLRESLEPLHAAIRAIDAKLVLLGGGNLQPKGIHPPALATPLPPAAAPSKVAVKKGLDFLQVEGREKENSNDNAISAFY